MSYRGGVLPCLPAGRQKEVPLERGLLRVMVRYPLVVLVEQGRLSQEEAADRLILDPTGGAGRRSEGAHAGGETSQLVESAS